MSEQYATTLDEVLALRSENAQLREQLAKRTDALKAAQSVLQVLVTPGNEKISSLHIWTQAVAAETGARIALTDDLRKRPEKCPNGLEHGACLYPECVASCPGRLSVTSAQ